MDIRIQRVVRLIESRLDKPPSLATLARHAGLSVFYFHRLFRAETGEAVSAYCRRIRLEYAASRLRWTRDSILMIANASGYGSQAAFTRAFTDRFHVTPSRYRRLVRTRFHYIPRTVRKNPVSIRKVANLSCMSKRYIGERRLPCDHWLDFLKRLPGWFLGPASRATFFGLIYDSPQITDPERVRYDCCVQIPGADHRLGNRLLAGSGLQRLETRSGPYAALNLERSLPDSGLSEALILDYWLPNTRYSLADGPTIELFDTPPPPDSCEPVGCQILVPLR